MMYLLLIFPNKILVCFINKKKKKKKNSAYQVSKLVLDVWYAQYYKPLGHEASKPLNSGYLIYRIIKILLKVWLLGFQTYLDFVSPNQIVDVWWFVQNKAYTTVYFIIHIHCLPKQKIQV